MEIIMDPKDGIIKGNLSIQKEIHNGNNIKKNININTPKKNIIMTSLLNIIKNIVNTQSNIINTQDKIIKDLLIVIKIIKFNHI